MAEYYLGTMGFGYKDWLGVFYPSSLEPRNYLAHYSRIFNAVEIDSSFYGTPRQTTMQRWLALTTPEFRFCLKTPQSITHEGHLALSALEMAAFLQSASLLGERLGAVLLQFPPSFTQAQAGSLHDFLAALQEGPAAGWQGRMAVEFRHPSWYTAAGDTASLLAGYRVCWAATEYPDLPKETPVTTDFLYIRWIGQHGMYPQHTHLRQDRQAEMDGWWQHLQKRLGRVSTLFGFFNNDYAGFAPGSCNQFKRRLGLPAVDFTPPQQPKLFDLGS